MRKGHRFVRRIFMTAGAMLMSAVLVVALSGCTKTKFLNKWRDPAYTGQPKKILVHSVGRSPTVRIMFENHLVEQLGQHNVAAIASHQFLPGTLIVDREAIKRLAEEKGVDSIFIAGPTNRKDLESLRPGELSYAAALYEDEIGDYDNFNTFVSGFVLSAGTYAGEQVYVEMVLYDVTSGKRIWSALSRTNVWDSQGKEIRPVISRVIEMLVDDKIIS